MKTSFSEKKNLIQFLKFTAFSFSAGIIQILAFTLLFELINLAYWPSYLAALSLSVLYNFTVNRQFTFKSSANVPIAMLKVFAFYCVFTPLSTVGGNYLTDIRLWNGYVVLVLSMTINFVAEFLFCRFVVFTDSGSKSNTENSSKDF